MNTRLFNRAAFLTVGDRRFAIRLTFSVEKTSTPDADKCKVTAWNLSQSSQDFVEEKGKRLVLEAGYGDRLSTLFTGKTQKISFNRGGPDIQSVMEAGDSEENINENHVEVSFDKNAKLTQLLDVATVALGVAKGVVKGVKETQLENGFSFSGKARDLMDTVAKFSDADWTVRDGELQLLPPGTTTSEEAVLLNKNTGMLGTPTKTEEGFTARSLLNPLLNPGRLVIMESQRLTLSGNFRVTKVRHNGDSYEGPWFSDIEGVKANG